MPYIRHDENNNPVVPQPGKTTETQFGGTEGWSTVTYENFNADYVAYTYNSAAGIGTRTPGTYQRHDENNNPVTPGTYQRHDENNNPVLG
jgi:hypothetical protein